jgi:hypothetical protein
LRAIEKVGCSNVFPFFCYSVMCYKWPVFFSGASVRLLLELCVMALELLVLVVRRLALLLLLVVANGR